MPEFLEVVDCGRMVYAQAMALQRRVVEARQRGRRLDLLLLLEHEPVITLGRNARAANVLLPEPELRARGIELAECNRGGDVTYHGPGQLVGYPILDLRAAARPAFLPSRPAHLGLGAVEYVRALEQTLLDAAAGWGIDGRRVPGLTGVWTGEPPRKLAAIGVHIAHGVTSHGFALNLADQPGFDAIIPCGIATHGVTSLKRELGRTPDPAVVRNDVVRHFASVFCREARWVALEAIEADVPNLAQPELKRELAS